MARTDTQTDGHGDSLTDPAQRAESVKMPVLHMFFNQLGKLHNMITFVRYTFLLKGVQPFMQNVYFGMHAVYIFPESANMLIQSISQFVCMYVCLSVCGLHLRNNAPCKTEIFVISTCLNYNPKTLFK